MFRMAACYVRDVKQKANTHAQCRIITTTKDWTFGLSTAIFFMGDESAKAAR